MNPSPNESEPLATVYIISYHRPHCQTAQTLRDIHYPGPWYIVCGDNDETIPDYITNFGSDKVLVFDHAAYTSRTDLMDALSPDTPTGASPARNATADISASRGEHRHWQLDDDYRAFRIYRPSLHCPVYLDGQELYNLFTRLAQYADTANLANLGINWRANPATIHQPWTHQEYVVNAHNLKSPLEIPWRGRMLDDLIHTLDDYRHGRPEISLCAAQVDMPLTTTNVGGNTDLYEQETTFRKCCYGLMVNPAAVRIISKYGRYHWRIDWTKAAPRILSESRRKP